MYVGYFPYKNARKLYKKQIHFIFMKIDRRLYCWFLMYKIVVE